MRVASRVDENQQKIVKALRGIGCTVQSLAAVGGGCPDLVVGFRGARTNLLLEVKDGSKPPSRRKLTADQVIWHGQWAGQVSVVNSVDEAIAVVRQYMGNL